MRRFWADLIASLYNIRDGIVKKKEELDQEREDCESEKEELRDRIAELEASQSTDSLIVEPVAVLKNDSDIVKFDYTATTGIFLYKKDQFDYNENFHSYSIKDDGKLYIESVDGVKTGFTHYDNNSVPTLLIDNNNYPRYDNIGDSFVWDISSNYVNNLLDESDNINVEDLVFIYTPPAN